MKKIAIVMSLVAGIVAPMIAVAHPGHGETDGYTITHYFTEPVHVVLSLGVIAAIGTYVFFASRKKVQSKH